MEAVLGTENGASRTKKRDSEHSAKRAKIAQACEECRARKVRCNGAQPVCSACRRRRDEHVRGKCTYDLTRSSLNSSEYVALLEERLRRLERPGGDDVPMLAQDSVNQESFNANTAIKHPGQCRVSDSANTTQAQSNINGSDQEARTGTLSTSFSSTNARVVNPGTEGTTHASLSPREGVDGMGNIGVTENSYGEGNSSAASFMKQVKDAVASRLSLPRHELSDARWQDTKIHQHRHSTAEFFVLPPRRAADHMIEVYWNEVHVLYPFLHRPRFMQTYQNLWIGEAEKTNDHLIYCILNTIFAITCQVHKRFSPDEKTADADVYIQRAMKLLQVDVLAGGSIELIQALLLMGQYLQSTELPHSCWMVTGLAIRIAQGLGMHLPHTSANLVRQQDQEMTRRLWHGCVFMDRMVSMTFGRPRVVTKADATAVPFPASINDEYLSSDPGPGGLQPQDKPSFIEFYIRSLKLYLIQEKTLSAMYSNDTSDLKTKKTLRERLEDVDFNTILRIEGSLRMWDESLPPFLKVRDTASIDLTDPIFARQANVLHLRYLQVRILLLRPILSLMLTNEVPAAEMSSTATASDLTQTMALLCSRECVRSSQAVINLIYDRHIIPSDATIVEPLPAWWFNTFFIYTAATVLIPARIYPYIRGDIEQSSLTRSWQHVLCLLSGMIPISSTAKRCLAVLQMLNEESAVADEMGKAKATLAVGFARNDGLEVFPRNNLSAPTRPDMSMNPAPNFGDDVAVTASPTVGMVPDQNDMFSLSSTMLQGPDFTWFDSLPTDLLAIDNPEVFSLPQWNQS